MVNMGKTNISLVDMNSISEPKSTISSKFRSIVKPFAGRISSLVSRTGTRRNMQKLGTSPNDYLIRLLVERGYSAQTFDALLSPYVSKPSPEQIMDYQDDIIDAVKKCDVFAFQEFHRAGRSINPCNEFGESVIHLAARVNALDIVMYIVDHIGSEVLLTCDNFGRSPLHEVCLADVPSLEFASYILDNSTGMLLAKDIHGCTPLSYAHPDNWEQFIFFIDSVKEQHWPKY